MTWFANFLIVVGLLLAGSKNKFAFAFTFVGEVIWSAVAAYKEMWDLASICGLFALLAAVNFYRWSNDAKEKELS